MNKTKVIIKGTHCASCKALIEDVCKENQCVEVVTVDFKTGITVIEHKDCLDFQQLVDEVEGLGGYIVLKDI